MVTQNRECIFGSVIDDKMILNDVGQIVENEILESIKIRENWFFHNWIVMPNHVHLLIEIQKQNEILTTSHIPEEKIVEAQIVEAHGSASTSGTSTKIGANFTETHCRAPLQIQNLNKNADQSAVPNFNQAQLLSRKSKSISSFVAIFKSVTTKQINGTDSIWQSNYHDYIVRNYKRFETIYNYIKRNPRCWETDSINSNFQ